MILDLMRQEAEAGLLQYAVGRAITCPSCGQVMDWRRAAVVAHAVCCHDCLRKAVRDLHREGRSHLLREMDRAGDLVVGRRTQRRRAAYLGRRAARALV